MTINPGWNHERLDTRLLEHVAPGGGGGNHPDCCVLGKCEGWMKTAGCVVGGALLLIGIGVYFSSL